MNWSHDEYRYGDPALDAWVRAVPLVYADKALVERLRDQFLTPAERASIADDDGALYLFMSSACLADRASVSAGRAAARAASTNRDRRGPRAHPGRIDNRGSGSTNRRAPRSV